MNNYTKLLSKLNEHKSKVKDLPELISKVSFNRNRISLLQNITNFLEMNEDVLDFEWLENQDQKDSAKKKGRKIVAQFRYKVSSPHRCLTIYKKT